MALKTFILYFAPFLAGAFALFATVKQMVSAVANQGKRPFWYGLITSVVSSGIAFLASYIAANLFQLFWILASLYLLFGIIHVWLTHRRYFNHPREPRNKQFAAELLFALSIVAFSVAAFAALQYFLRDKDFLFYPLLMSLLFFFVPLLVYHTFKSVYAIPLPVYTVWNYPEQEIELPDEKENERLYVIGFELAKKGTDRETTYFRAKAPAEMVLGELFYHFINDYNEVQSETPIEFRYNREEQDHAHAWYFRTKPKWYTFSRILDPFQTVDNNKIKENTVIICERAGV